MPKKIAPDTVQITLRVPFDWLELADELAMKLSRPGMLASRTDAFRQAIIRGIEVLSEEHGGMPKKAPPSKPKKPTK